MQLHWRVNSVRESAGDEREQCAPSPAQHLLVHQAERAIHDPGKQAFDEDAA
jgi:hypothetical protein